MFQLFYWVTLSEFITILWKSTSSEFLCSTVLSIVVKSIKNITKSMAKHGCFSKIQEEHEIYHYGHFKKSY